MHHSCNTLAAVYHLNKKEFKDFALKNINKYHLDVVDMDADVKDIFVSTWFVDDIIEDFKKVCEEYLFVFETSSGRHEAHFYASNNASAKVSAEIFANENGYTFVGQ